LPRPRIQDGAVRDWDWDVSARVMDQAPGLEMRVIVRGWMRVKWWAADAGEW